MPDSSDNYQLPSWPPTKINRDLWNAVMGSIGERLTAREELEADFEALIAQGTQASLDYIQATVAPQVASLQASIELAQEQIDQIIIDGIAPNSAKLGGQLPAYYATATSVSSLATSKADVSYVDQELLDLATAIQLLLDQKAGATAMADALAKRVRVDAAQSLSAAESGRARSNIGAGVLAGFRNKLINGAAQIIQRGGRTIAAGASAYVFDRFLVTNNTNQTLTVSQIVFALGSGFAREARNAMRFNFAAAPTTGTLRIEQRIEFVDSIRSTDHTFIAWMSGPSGSEAVAAEFVQNFGTGGSPSAQVVTPMIFAGASPTTIFSASSNRRAWGVTAPSLSSKLLGTNGNDYAATAIVMTPRQAGNYDLTWLSFVEGDATAEDDPFAARHPQQELALCQRYYEAQFIITASAAFGGAVGGAAVNQGNWATHKRAAPSISVGDFTLGTGMTAVALGLTGWRQNALHSAVGGATITGDAEL